MPDLFDDPTDYDSPTSYGNPELMRQAARLARRKAQLELDAESSARQIGLYRPAQATSTGGFTSHVTGASVPGIVTKAPLLSQLTPLIGDTSRGVQESKYDDDVSGYRREEAKVAQRVMSEMPTAGDAPGPYGVNVPTQPTVQQMLQWAQRASQVPSLAPLANAFMSEAVKLPAAQAAQRWEHYKFAAQQQLERDKLAHEQGKPVAVSQVGLFERDPNSPGGYKQVPGTSPSGTLQPVVNPRTGDVSSFNNRTGTVTRSDGGAGAGAVSPEVVKREEDTKTKVANFDAVISLIDNAMPELAKVNPGAKGYGIDLWDKYWNAVSTDSTKARERLDVLAENLKPYYNRPPGDPTASEVAAWGRAMGALNSPVSNVADRKAAADMVVQIMRDQRERLSGTAPGTDTSGSVPVEGSSKLRMPAPAPSSGDKPRFSAEQREAFGSQLMAEWSGTSPANRPAIEQRMLSVGATRKGWRYQGGDPTARSSWAKE